MSKPIGPYTPVVAAGPWLVCSGQLGIVTGPDGAPQLVPGGVEEQTLQALENVSALLATKGARWPQVAKVTVFLRDIADYARFNTVYSEFLGDSRPARSVVGVAGLPMDALVEIEVWAFTGQR